MVFRFYFSLPTLKYYQDIRADSFEKAKELFDEIHKGQICSIGLIINMTAGEVVWDYGK